MNPERQRRPMTVALQTSDKLPPEAIALIREGTPKSRVATSPLEPEVTAPTKSEATTPMKDSVAPVLPKTDESTDPSPESGVSAKTGKLKVVREREPEPVAINALVSLTVRVSSDIPSALVRASADRKAKRVRPFTQQEIVTEALTQWFKRNGY